MQSSLNYFPMTKLNATCFCLGALMDIWAKDVNLRIWMGHICVSCFVRTNFSFFLSYTVCVSVCLGKIRVRSQ